MENLSPDRLSAIAAAILLILAAWENAVGVFVASCIGLAAMLFAARVERPKGGRPAATVGFSLAIAVSVVMVGLAGCAASEIGTAETKPGTLAPGDGVNDPENELTASEMGLIAYLEAPERLTVGERINLKFVLKNVSETPLYILKWYTPLEGIAGEIFRVTRDGQPVPYEGILASRTPPTADQYVLLYPGEPVWAAVDLAEGYDFSKAGVYRIKFISPRISHIARTEDEMAQTMEDLGPVDMPSNEVTIELVD